MTEFSSLKIVGGLLPADILGRIFAGDPQVPGTRPHTYGLERGESVRRQASRSWLYLLEVWQDFKQRVAEDDAATSVRVTRERWLRILLRELGFHHMTAGSFEIEGKSFPVSHQAGPTPVHMLGWSTDLDHKTPHVTARAPQSMLQELLNRDDAYLWAILSNGATLRLLRDSAALTGSAYVEFDLEAIFDGELFSDFVLLYLICHESRFAVQDDGGPASCYLEQWRSFAADQGERALEQLRAGVEQAITILGTGFLSHPDNPQLRIRLGNGELKLDDLNRALLRVVYRMLFWFVAEERRALLQPDPEDADEPTRRRLREARQRYDQYFSSARLRQLARRRRGDRHGDLWDAVQLVFDALGTEGGVPELALPGIGGIFETALDDGRALPLDEPLVGARLSNEALLGAVRALSLVKPRDGGAWRRVDFGNLGAEELGSVYESLLELIPRYDTEQLSYTLKTLAGNERKETGSYYTPTSLVECLLDSALDPLLEEACAHGPTEERVAALLGLTVCDPACGSGHFLVAAARRIAKRIAAEETGDSEPPDAVVRTALRRVVGRCIYGVDVNPMAAELAKVSLWLEALEPGKPLSYLDQNIRVGNSLFGVTPALLADGLPDEAFKPIEGDDRKVCSSLKKQNAAERQGQHDLFAQSGIPVTNAVLAERADEITLRLPDSLEDQHIHQQRQADQLAASSERRIQKLLADAWCAAFVQPKNDITRSTAITQAILEQFGADGGTLDLAEAEDLVADLTRQYRFFHWHVEFPRIFRVGNGHTDTDPATGWSGGFSCVIGNPPWDQVQLDPQEFFASRKPTIANAANMAARNALISTLAESDPALYSDYKMEQRRNDGMKHFVHESSLFPLTSYGRLNTYSLFAETSRTVLSAEGRSGLILPTGIATDSFNQYFFGDLVKTKNLVSIYDFENEEKIFPSVHNQFRFCLLAISGRGTSIDEIRLAFRARQVRHIEAKRFTLTPEDISRLNPNTLTCPVFDEPRHAEIVKNIYQRAPVLWRENPEENPWELSFQLMFMMNTDSQLFWTSGLLQDDAWRLEGNVFVHSDKRMLPLYEAKMIHHFNSRFATYEGATEAQLNKGTLPRLTLSQHEDSDFLPMPRYWVDAAEVNNRLARRAWNKDWLLGWRDITTAANERTMICSVLPRAAVGHTCPLMLSKTSLTDCLYANLASFVLDYVARQKMAGTHLTFGYVTQLPVLPPVAHETSVPWLYTTPADWIRPRVLELTYTAYDVAPFAAELGDNGPPFKWDEERRFQIRAELDAAYFQLYGMEQNDVDYIMDSFRAFQNNDRPRFERTKALILEIYDAMAEAALTGKPYETILDPPPGQGPRHG
jgi:hypothetical protein